MKMNPKLLIIAGVVLLYAFTVGLIVPGFVDEGIITVVLYLVFGR